MLKFSFSTPTNYLDIGVIERRIEDLKAANLGGVPYYENMLTETKAILESDTFKELESTLHAINPLLERAVELAKELNINFIIENSNYETLMSFDAGSGFCSPQWRSSSSNC